MVRFLKKSAQLEKSGSVCYSLRTARLAQLVEHSTDTRKVLGSIPRARTKIVIHTFRVSDKITLALWRTDSIIKVSFSGVCAVSLLRGAKDPAQRYYINN